MKNRILIRLFNSCPQGKITERPQKLLKAEAQENNSQETNAENKTIIEGYATLYDVKTDLFFYSLSIDKGAFTELKAELGDVVSLFNHDWDYVLGRTPDTLKLDPNHEYGLWQETILPNHDLGKRIAEDINRGALTQQSVTFFIEEYNYSEGNGKDQLDNFHVTKASLVDVSVVTFGQYPETTIGIQKMHAEKSTKEVYEKLLSEHKETSAISEQMEKIYEVQLKLQEQRKRRVRGIHGF